jgi:CheY-like chemotaxis protein
LREWGNRAPDLLVSDIALPGTDGYELLRRLRARSGSIFVPALAVTAHAFGDDRARAFAAGFQGHIAKPIDPAAFVAAAVSVLHAHA